jgi:hypothetical protein
MLNLLAGAMLLITLSYFVPSASQQRNTTPTEWVRIVKQEHKKLQSPSKSAQPSLLVVIEFDSRIFNFKSRIQVALGQNKLNQLPYPGVRVAPSKIISDDDDYLFS